MAHPHLRQPLASRGSARTRAWLQSWGAAHFSFTMWECGSTPAAQRSVRGAGPLGKYEGKLTPRLFIETPFPALCENQTSTTISTITAITARQPGAALSPSPHIRQREKGDTSKPEQNTKANQQPTRSNPPAPYSSIFSGLGSILPPRPPHPPPGRLETRFWVPPGPWLLAPCVAGAVSPTP